MRRQRSQKSRKTLARPSHGGLGIVKSVTSTEYVALECFSEVSTRYRREKVEKATRCVAGGCNNFPNLKEGIALQTIPYYGDDRPEARSGSILSNVSGPSGSRQRPPLFARNTVQTQGLQEKVFVFCRA